MADADTSAGAARIKPLLIFDGDCGFCRRWVVRWRAQTRGSVDFAPFQESSESLPGVSLEAMAGAVHLLEPDGRVYRGAEAVFRMLHQSPGGRWRWRAFRVVPGVAACSEFFYRTVARHRGFFSRLTALVWGEEPIGSGGRLTRHIFLRGLGLVYFIAFASLWSQVEGLVGREGILPLAPYLEYVAQHSGPERYWLAPTLCWINDGDAALSGFCAAGAGLAALVLLGFLQGPCLVALWTLYLSMTVAGQVFLGFQWDNLLLETGLLAVFLAPWSLRARVDRDPPPSRVVVWMFRLLLFKLMFSSGMVKLLSGDDAWRNLTALTYHYETQCLPTWLAWYAHQLPLRVQIESCRVMFLVELTTPFFIFLPGRLRLFAFFPLVFLQLLIVATGNYTFFNWLSLLLCLLLLEDTAWPRALRRRLPADPLAAPRRVWTWPRRVVAGLSAAVLAVILLINAMQILGTMRINVAWPAWTIRLYRGISPLRSVNTYGLFAVMTRTRPEILVEGSMDGEKWLAYEFKWKPGDPRRRPEFVAPHQPRLDWQMWFAALGSFEGNRWVGNLLVRLAQGSPAVLGLLHRNPFPGGPPRYIRAGLYEYHFTDWKTRRAEGTWWRIQPLRAYSPVLTLREE